jgi:hypothetical protein
MRVDRYTSLGRSRGPLYSHERDGCVMEKKETFSYSCRANISKAKKIEIKQMCVCWGRVAFDAVSLPIPCCIVTFSSVNFVLHFLIYHENFHDPFSREMTFFTLAWSQRHGSFFDSRNFVPSSN